MTKTALFTKFIFFVFAFIALPGCMPMIHPPGEVIVSGQILKDRYITPDGAALPLKRWLPEQESAKAVLIAIHGFNDYSNFFQQPGGYFKQHRIASYAYDQRGFGGSPQRGLWSGVDAYVRDLDLFISLVKLKHPGLPIFLLGESMGGAIVIVTMTQKTIPNVDGIILSAPAVWARETMPWYQQTLLWTLSHTLPWMTLTGESVGVMPSDNIEMLRALGKDPLIIRETRVEAIYGLVNLMDNAYLNAPLIRSNTLLLYGEKDEIIPKEPTHDFLQEILNTDRQGKKIALYENGYHMLLRDLQAPVLWQDIVSWIESSQSPLPSGADKRAEEVFTIPQEKYPQTRAASVSF